MNKRLFKYLALLLVFQIVIAAPAVGDELEKVDMLTTRSEPGRSGGELVVALRPGPKTLNPLVAADISSLIVIRRTMADLIHIDRSTQQTNNALARAWERSSDGRTFRIELRRGLRFSDGHPLDAGDVQFSFQAYMDEATGSPYRSQLVDGDEQLEIEVLDSHTLRFEFPRADAWGERIFNDLFILPQHRLQAAFEAGKLAEAWSLQTAPEDIVGLGPFRIKRIVAGERLELERNPHFWKTDREGAQLPYLEELTFLVTTNEEADIARFRAGDTHLIDRLSAASFGQLERDSQNKNFEMHDLGAGLGYEFLFFNMNPLGDRALPAIEKKQAWFRNLLFRRAVSSAIDRQSLVRLVYEGRATPIATHVSPGNKLWAHPGLEPDEHSPARAKRLMKEAGFELDSKNRWRDGDGDLVELNLLINSALPEKRQMASLIQSDLEALGIRVTVTPLEIRSLLQRIFETYEYEACLLGLGAGDGDPSSGQAVWLSGGAHRFWNLGADATPWESEIGQLMRQQKTQLDVDLRKRLNTQMQEKIAQNLPLIFLLSPNVLVGARRDLSNFSPAILESYTLWNSEELFWRPSATAAPENQ